MTRLEITEARKEIEHDVEVIDTERQPHVVLEKAKVLIFQLPRRGDAFFRQIYAGNIEPFVCRYLACRPRPQATSSMRAPGAGRR